MKFSKGMSPTSVAFGEIKVCAGELVDGLVVAIDPSIGSNSSMPGWAVYSAGDLLDSGIFRLNPGRPKAERLQELAFQLGNLYRKHGIQAAGCVLVYESPTDVPFKGQPAAAARSLASLHKAVGCILGVEGPNAWAGIPPASWKRLARPEYVKSDENDAIEIGWVAIEQARLILASKANGKKRNTREKPV